MSSMITREQIVTKVRERLGNDASADMVNQVVDRVMELESASKEPEPAPPAGTAPKELGNRIIVAVFGVNQPGIVAGVSRVLAEHKCDILILVVDLTNSPVSFEELHTSLENLAQELGINIHAQHEDVFQAVNRL